MPSIIGGDKCDCGNTDTTWIMVRCDCGRSICWNCAEYNDNGDMVCPNCKKVIDWSNHPFAKELPNDDCKNCICYQSKCYYRDDFGFCTRHDFMPQCGESNCTVESCLSVKRGGIKKRPW